MTVSTVVANKKSSKVAKNPRPVEDKVIVNETKKESEVLIPAFGNDEKITELHHKTRIFVKRLFSAKNQEDVDRIVADAVEESGKFEEDFGENPHYEFRIRNAEIQVRRHLEAGYDLSKVNPVVSCVVLETLHSTTTVDSWGHLADRLLKGYKVLIEQ